MYIEDWVITWSEEHRTGVVVVLLRHIFQGRVSLSSPPYPLSKGMLYSYLKWYNFCSQARLLSHQASFNFAHQDNSNIASIRLPWQPSVSKKLINCGWNKKSYPLQCVDGVRFQDETLKVKSCCVEFWFGLSVFGQVRSVARECNSKLWWLHMIWTLFNIPCRHCIVAQPPPPYQENKKYTAQRSCLQKQHSTHFFYFLYISWRALSFHTACTALWMLGCFTNIFSIHSTQFYRGKNKAQSSLLHIKEGTSSVLKEPQGGPIGI